MNTRLKLLGAVLRKDLRLFWLLAVLTAVFNALANIRAMVQPLPMIDDLVVAAAFLATGLFILLVFQEDSAVCGRRDWLTRPVPGMTVLATKCIFVVLLVVLPGVLGAILNGFYLGRPPAEALVTGVAIGLTGDALLGVLCMMVLAALTSGIRHAVVTSLVCIVMLALGFTFWFPVGTDTTSGSNWMLTRPLELLATFAALAVLWIMYRRRHGRRAALVLIGVTVLAGGTWLATLNGSRMLGLQRWLSPDPAAASSVALSVLPGCYPASSATEKIPVEIFSYRQREQAGADAVPITVRLVVDRIQEGGTLLLGQTQLTYRTGDGVPVSLGAGRTSPKWVTTESGHRARDQYWLLSKQDYQRLAATPGTTTHLDYSLSLLATSASALFPADGRRVFRGGIGYCGITVTPENKRGYVDCYRTGAQPALLAARLEGQSDIEDRASDDPDFAPAILDFWGGRRHKMFIPDVAAQRVRITAYEARVHFNRQFDVSGVLGGTVPSCPVN